MGEFNDEAPYYLYEIILKVNGIFEVLIIFQTHDIIYILTR